MASVHNLIVIRKPRDDPIPDIPISFPPFKNLHLELLEVKDKLKPGLPLIPRVAPKPQIPAVPVPVHRDKPKVIPPVAPDPVVSTEKKSKVTPPVKEKSAPPPLPSKPADESVPKSESVSKSKPKDEKDDLVLDLGEDSDDESIFEDSDDDDAPAPVEMTDHDIDEATVPDEDDEYDPYAGLSPEEREEKEREEYVWRFRILKKQYGRTSTIPIPEYNEHSDVAMMKTSYERTIRELYLDDAVETYRTYLLGGWIVMEYVCTQWIGIDLRGFTIQQTRMMYKYDRMLIELGEKSYTRWGMNLPVEVRLLGMILFQAGIFYLGKIISDKFGTSIAELFKGFTGQPPDAISTESPGTGGDAEEVNDATPRKKMRGPNIKASDIRNRTAKQNTDA